MRLFRRKFKVCDLKFEVCRLLAVLITNCYKFTNGTLLFSFFRISNRFPTKGGFDKANVVRCLIFLLFFSQFAFAADDFKEANRLYMSQQYDKAGVAYDSLIKLGNKSYEVYFNLGNSYYKTGNYAAAVLNYERAKKLNPADEDVQFNLALANLNTVDKIEPAPKVFYERWWEDFLLSSTPDKRSLTGIILIWIAALAACGYIFSNKASLKRISFFVSLLILFCGLFFILLASRQVALATNNREAIIYKPSAYVKSSPDDKSTNLFMLHAGTKIEVIDQLEGWKKIRIPNGNVGWIKDDEAEVI